MIDVEIFQAAMRRVAAPVAAITTFSGGQKAGLLATSFCSLSADPPSILVCVNRTASAHDAILAAGAFGVSLLPEDQLDDALFFAVKSGAERFDRGEWALGITGVPLLRHAPVAFEAKIANCHDGYTHSILVATVEHIAFAEQAETNCLLWHGRAFARLRDTSDPVAALK